MIRSAAEDVIHRKVMLAEGWTNPFYESFCDGWLRYERSPDWVGSGGIAASLGMVDSVGRMYENGRAMLADMQQTLRSTENFWVSKSMMDLALQIAPSMPDEDLLPPDLPARQGWMWYEVPYRQIDVRRQVLYDNAIMWSAWGEKVRVWHFTDKAQTGDSVNEAILGVEGYYEQLPQLMLSHVFDMHFNQHLPRGLTWDTPLPPGARLDVRKFKNDDGSESLMYAIDESIDISEEPKVMRSPLAAFIVCLWRLCQQSIADRWSEDLQRHTRRRMTRAHLPVSPISVITLRRREQHSDDGETHVDWQHRWMVRGHWRKQPYKEVNEEGEKVTVYRNIYINPFIKGPEDKPLLIRDKVNALIR